MVQPAVPLADHLERLSEAVQTSGHVPAGRLWGLPDLEDDCWVDIAGASVLTGQRPNTISGWLSRKGPKRNPFPRPYRLLYRLYWRRSAIEAWLVEEHA